MLPKIKNFYFKYEVSLSYLSLVLGFVIDSLTLTRIDRLRDIIWIATHILFASTAIIILNRFRNRPTMHFWMILLLQFAFGGLLSACLVFYFRGATLATNWPFLLILLVTFIGNELLKKHFEKLAFQISFLFFSIFSFAIFFIPVIFKKVGDGMFVVSGIVSLVFIGLVLLILYNLTRERFVQSGRWVLGSIVGVFALMNIFYFTNIIPPLPLMMKSSGTYYSIAKTSSDYILDGISSEEIHKHIFPAQRTMDKGNTVYAYSAIFSPANLNLTIIHEWQHWNEQERTWQTHSDITLAVKGGRDNGFRTYSLSSFPESGKWRVNVKTVSGSTIGRIRFQIQ